MADEERKEEGKVEEKVEDVNAVVLWLRNEVKALNRRLEALEKAINENHELLVRDAVADIPEVFEVKGQKLELRHPSFYKLELIGEIIDEMMEIAKADKEAREKLYEVLQVIFDPEPDPDRSNLKVDVRLVKCLDPVRVIEALVRKSVPFSRAILRLATFGRRSAGLGRTGAVSA